MKKICLILTLAVALLSMTACNQNIELGNFQWKKIHIDTYHHSGCYTINNCHETSTGIEVKTNELGSIFVSAGAYILVEDKCPICD